MRLLGSWGVAYQHLLRVACLTTVILLSVFITLFAFFVRSFFQSAPASWAALSDRKAHSGFGRLCSLRAWSQADANSLNVGAWPLDQNVLARILAMAPSS